MLSVRILDTQRSPVIFPRHTRLPEQGLRGPTLERAGSGITLPLPRTPKMRLCHGCIQPRLGAGRVFEPWPAEAGSTWEASGSAPKVQRPPRSLPPCANPCKILSTQHGRWEEITRNLVLRKAWGHSYGKIPPFSPASAGARTSVHVTATKPHADRCTSQPILGVLVRRCRSR